MKQRRNRFTRTAQTHVEHERAWWIENRDHTGVFAEELEQALRVLAVLPGAGTPYTAAGTRGLCRTYLGKIGCHIYYTFDTGETATMIPAGPSATETLGIAIARVVTRSRGTCICRAGRT